MTSLSLASIPFNEDSTCPLTHTDLCRTQMTAPRIVLFFNGDSDMRTRRTNRGKLRQHHPAPVPVSSTPCSLFTKTSGGKMDPHSSNTTATGVAFSVAAAKSKNSNPGPAHPVAPKQNHKPKRLDDRRPIVFTSEKALPGQCRSPAVINCPPKPTTVVTKATYHQREA